MLLAFYSLYFTLKLDLTSNIQFSNRHKEIKINSNIKNSNKDFSSRVEKDFSSFKKRRFEIK